ncbi:MAG: gliding motility-associated C-terminal domain-containing protein [Bacteroidales bacterium]|nr:gliding motility-associated C-terminal domain-containing protein [Bacteroidales bacterium]
MIKKIIYIISLPVFNLLTALPQTTDQPPRPEIYKVTVDPFTGFDSIIWYPQTDTLIDYYSVCHPKITNPAYPFVLDSPIAEVNAGTFFYVNENTTSGTESVGYSVIAVHLRADNTTVQSLYDYPDSTVYLTAVFDSCKAEVQLSWNKYNTWNGNTDSYRVYQIQEGHDPEVVAIIALEDITSYVVSILDNSRLKYFVEVLHKDKLRSSRSNMVTVNAEMLEIPDYIVASNALPSSSNTVQLTFYVDHASQLSEYQLWRSNALNGDYQLVNTFKNYDHIITISDAVDHGSGVYYYKLAALNMCSESIRTSNTINTILLEGSNTNLTNHLAWNNIEDWEGETGNYIVYRRVAGSSETDSIVLSSQTEYDDDLTDYFEGSLASSGEFCYHVKASEINNPHNINGAVYSNEFCISVTPGVKMPNAFIPNNPSGENNQLRPIFLYEPISYSLTIYNRWGNKIWEGEGPWDGKTNNEFVPEGTYVYQLTVVYPDNKNTITGYVTVIYR